MSESSVGATSLEGMRVEGDVCVVGAGVTADAITAELAGGGLAVVVLAPPASGSDAGDENLRELYRPHAPYLAGLRRAREPTLPLCVALPPTERRPRPWVEDSGWPEELELEPWLRAARDAWGTVTATASVDTGLFGKPPAFESSPVDTATVANPWSAKDGGTDSPRVLADASVEGWALDEPGTTVRELLVRRADGSRLAVSARRFVLAAGAIDNARLLLLADRERPGSLGNSHDLVGRFFQDAITCPIGTLMGRAPDPIGDALPGGWWLPASWLQERHELLSSRLALETFDGPPPGLSAEIGAYLGDERAWQHLATLTVETPPRREHRVRLADTVDEAGVPLPRLDWHDHEYPTWTLRATGHRLAETVGGAGAARLRMPRIRGLPRHAMPMSQPGGTTRMNADPRRGVVDLDGLVHTTTNLYVAGASVFPTLGCLPPQLTSTALTLRLADHLRRAIGA